jgi:lipopolysaccharide/colanic/teichoic acid biosynthesis glycosyltransferase
MWISAMTAIELQAPPLDNRRTVPVLEGLSIQVADTDWPLLMEMSRLRVWLFRVVCVTRTRLTAGIKRLIDIVAATALLMALSPIFLLVAVIIKLNDGGPAFFWQQRVGRWGRPFWFPKFRSMTVDAEQKKSLLLSQNDHGDSVTFKMKQDPRITWIGKLIRKTSIDELPQLWCVLKADMSLVGPRPPVPQEVAKYTLEQRRRLEVSPGLTCLWQVSGRGDVPFARQVELDVEYIESRSLWMDLRILLKTVPAVLCCRGAY